MNKCKAILAICLFSFLAGCAGPRHGAVKITDHFCTYPNETFVVSGTGETGFHVEGQDWYALMGLAGFEDPGKRYVASSQFLFMENGEGVKLSVFAEKIPGVDNSYSCTEHFKRLRSFGSGNEGEKTGDAPLVHDEMREAGGMSFMVRDVSYGEHRIRHLFYTPCYKGYCFDFHFSMEPDDARMGKVLGILGSLRFTEGKIPVSSVRKLVYTRDHRFELIIPERWSCDLMESSKPFMIPAIALKLSGGERFTTLITPFTAQEKLPLMTREQAKSLLLKQMEEIGPSAREKPVLREEKNGRAGILSFVAEDRTYRPGSVDDWPFMWEGFAFVDDAALLFTIFYQADAAEEARKAFEIITSSRVLNLHEAAERERSSAK